jgi:hypothetical protein
MVFQNSILLEDCIYIADQVLSSNISVFHLTKYTFTGDREVRLFVRSLVGRKDQNVVYNLISANLFNL